jgi:hypothetical protein
MKTIKRLFNKLFNSEYIDEKEQDSQEMCIGNKEENDGATVIKNVSWLKRKQDSIKEIFLMCMTPYM